jgi:hypothetical protein
MENFLKKTFNVTDLRHINPRKQWNAPATLDVLKEVTRKYTLTYEGQYLIQAPLEKDTNLERVSVRFETLRYVKNPTRETFFIGRNYVHVAAITEHEELERIKQEHGYPPNTLHIARPNEDKAAFVKFIEENKAVLYLNKEFLLTFMLINERNMMNGVIRIPNEVMEAEGIGPGYATFDQNNMAVAHMADYFVLIDAKSVLGWCLDIPLETQKLFGLFSYQITIDDKYILFYIVPNQVLDRIKADLVASYLTDKIDLRPLRSVGAAVRPANSEYRDPVGPELTVSVTYICSREMTQDQVDRLYPALDEGFIRYPEVLRRKEALMKIKKAEEEERRRLEQMEDPQDPPKN